MPRAIRFSVMLFAAITAWGQAAPPANTPAERGVESEWDLKKMLDALSSGARKMKPVIEAANPQQWSDPHAAEAYTSQWKSAQSEITYLVATTDKFAKEPERLTLAIETFFRMQALHTTVGSLADGIRQHQNPALANQLQALLSEGMNNSERLKNYLFELAQTKEQEFKIMDKEAQRCRGMLNRQTPATTPPARDRAKPRSSNQ